MEAISFGIPVLATSVGGVPEIVNRRTGHLVDTISKAQFEAYLAAHPEQKEALTSGQ